MFPFRRPRGYAGTVQSVAPSNLVAYWPLDDAPGTVARDATGSGRNAAYAGSPAAATGIGDGRTAVTFDAVDDTVNLYSASFASAFSGLEGSLSMWVRASGAGVWSDSSTNRRFITLQADGSNRFLIQRTTVLNQMHWLCTFGGTGITVTKTTTAPTDWFHIGLTWSKSGNALQPYYNGVAEGSPQAIAGTFAGSLHSLTTLLGGSSTSGGLWSGYEAHVAIWNTPISAAQMARLATA